MLLQSTRRGNDALPADTGSTTLYTVDANSRASRQAEMAFVCMILLAERHPWCTLRYGRLYLPVWRQVALSSLPG